MAEVQRDTAGSAEDTVRFLEMVGLFGSQAMISLGKVINPATGKTEKNLPVAKLFIDTLEMIERKTQGNLSKDEARTLRGTLTDLRMMFVEESKSGSDAGDKAAGASQTESKDAPDAADKSSKVKFHKSYE